METSKTIKIFSAKLQKICDFQGMVDQNGEYLFKNTEADEFLKFAADTTPEQFVEYIKTHQEMNSGQISIDKQNENLMTLLNAVSE